LDPAVKVTPSDRFDAVTAVIVGALGRVVAIPLATDEAVPAPTAFTARSST
jgi:hypothetical protein